MEFPNPVLTYVDFAILAAIAWIFGGFAGSHLFTSELRKSLRQLEKQIEQLQYTLSFVVKHHGIELPPPLSGLSTEAEALAIANQKIAAIKLYREQNPGAGLLEAKQKVEAFLANRTSSTP